MDFADFYAFLHGAPLQSAGTPGGAPAAPPAAPQATMPVAHAMAMPRSTAPAQQPAPAQRSAQQQGPAPQPASWLDGLKRQAGLTLRTLAPIGTGAALGAAGGAVLGGVGAIPGAFAGASAVGLTELLDALSGSNSIPKLLDQIGLPKPETTGERVTQAVIGAVPAVMSAAGTAKYFAKSMSPGLAKNVVTQLSVNPAAQVGSGAGAAATGTWARDEGATPWEQFLASMVGGALPPATLGVTRWGVNATTNAVRSATGANAPTSLDATIKGALDQLTSGPTWAGRGYPANAPLRQGAAPASAQGENLGPGALARPAFYHDAGAGANGATSASSAAPNGMGGVSPMGGTTYTLPEFTFPGLLSQAAPKLDNTIETAAGNGRMPTIWDVSGNGTNAPLRQDAAPASALRQNLGPDPSARPAPYQDAGTGADRVGATPLVAPDGTDGVSPTGGTTYAQRWKQTPISNGYWTGVRGESEFISTHPDIVPILGDKGIRYSNCYPDFSEVAHDQFEIPNMSVNRDSNFAEADKRLAEKWEISPREVEAWRLQNDYTWHEHEDLKTMQLVPRAINAKFGHVGGVGELNAGKW